MTDSSIPVLHSTLCCAALVLFLVGCAKQPDIGLVEGHGIIRMDNQPLANAEVVFELGGMYGPTVTRGRTDAEGRYRLTFANSYRGTFKGKQKVRITALEDVGQQPIPARYNEQSVLTVEVTEGGAPYDFDLTSLPAEEP